MTFPPDRGLQAWLAVIVLLQVTLLVALAGALAWLTAEPGPFVLILVAGVVFAGAIAPRQEARRSGRIPDEDDRRPVRAIAERLAVVADVAAPEIAVLRFAAPLSWTSAVQGGRTRST